AIWLQMAQILALAPSIRPPMLPVVSRQKTTSTFGFSAFFSACFSGCLSAAFSSAATGRRPTRANAASQYRCFTKSILRAGMFGFVLFDAGGWASDCNRGATGDQQPEVRGQKSEVRQNRPIRTATVKERLSAPLADARGSDF